MKKPIHERDIQPTIWYEGTDRELHGIPLCDIGGHSKIGFGVCELAPACNTRPGHYHTLEEEHLYVLEGTGILHLGNQEFALSTGSYVHFPAGQQQAHYLSNNSGGWLRYIMVGERNSEDEVVYLADDENLA